MTDRPLIPRISAGHTAHRAALIATPLVLGLASLHSSAQCTPDWSDRFRIAGIEVGQVAAAVTHDDGAGPALYLGGRFTYAGGRVVNSVVKWDGESFVPLGGGVCCGGSVSAFASFDPDGPGGQPAVLVVGGDFIGGVNADGNEVYAQSFMLWKNGVWQGVDYDFNSDFGSYDAPGVASLLVANVDGTGDRLYIGGGFTERVAWTSDLSTFQTIASPYPDDGVLAMTAFDPDAAGPLSARVFFAGRFSGGVAQLNGTAFSIVPGSSGHEARALAVFDPDGAGPALPSLHVPAADQFRTWNAVDGWANFPSFAGAFGYGRIDALTVANLGAGQRLFIGGDFAVSPPSGQPQSAYLDVVQWDGSSLQSLGSGVEKFDQSGDSDRRGVFCFAPCTHRGQPALLVGGAGLIAAGQAPAFNLAFWNGSAWEPQYEGQTHGLPQMHRGLTSIDTDASGPLPARLLSYIEPASRIAGDRLFPDNLIVELTSAGWRVPSPPIPDPEGFDSARFIMFDDGNGPTLYVWGHQYGSGVHTPIGPYPRLARLVSGTSWEVVSGDLGSGILNAAVVYDPDGPGGSPGTLVIAGNTTSERSPTFPNIAGWNGTSWVQVGGGFPDTAPDGGDKVITSLAVFQNTLFACGKLGSPAAFTTDIVARLDGNTWTTVASTTGTFAFSLAARTLAVVDVGGSGPALYLGGQFLYPVSGNTIEGVGRWNGTSFLALGTGLTGVYGTGDVWAMNEFNDGTGTKLYVSGNFNTAGGLPADYTAVWDGTAWSDMPGSPVARAFIVHDDDASGPVPPALYIDGDLAYSGQTFSAGIARFGCDAPVCTADFNTSGSVTVQDIFDFLSAWFAGTPSADFNHVGGVTVQDIFDFLGAWFAGC